MGGTLGVLPESGPEGLGWGHSPLLCNDFRMDIAIGWHWAFEGQWAPLGLVVGQCDCSQVGTTQPAPPLFPLEAEDLEKSCGEPIIPKASGLQIIGKTGF